MMKARIYIKIANGRKGVRVSASEKVDREPFLASTHNSTYYLPTVLFALDLDIPDKEFEASRILLNAKIEETIPAVEVKQVKQ